MLQNDVRELDEQILQFGRNKSLKTLNKFPTWEFINTLDDAAKLFGLVGKIAKGKDTDENVYFKLRGKCS